MVRSTEIVRDLQQMMSIDDWKSLESILSGVEIEQGRRARKNILADINKKIIDVALKNNRPEILQALQEVQSNEIDELFSCIIRQYIVTKDPRWLTAVFSLSEKIGKKSNQSRVFAIIARDLIDAGVSESSQMLIDQGMIMLDRISFRKYRSDIMIDIIPLLIVWAITTRSKKILYSSLILIEEIGDISRRAVLHSELAKALATIAILEKDRNAFYESIQNATIIHQKIRRQNCISVIIEKGSKSAFSKEMADIPAFMGNFESVPHEAYLEIISALTEQLLERVKDKSQIFSILEELCSDKPDVTGTIVIDLLKKAERSGDGWFLVTALNLQNHILDKDTFPIREMVRAGISVARTSNDMEVLSNLIPVINKHCNTGMVSRIYLQFSQIMLSAGDFSSALGIFGKINHEMESPSNYSDCLIQFLKEGILNDSIPLIYNNILIRLNPDLVNNAIYRATIETNKESSFKDLIAHILSVRNLILLHPKQDHLLLESITILVDRGFLDSNDPGILIRLAESIREQSLKERAISSIVIKIAKMGVKAKNRDFLQRAVGLTCEIDGQNTRSAALSSIIDEASILAAQQGDLDLLLRMKVWSNSLLEKDLASYAMANIIDGVIKYAIDRQSFEALEEAFLIAEDIEDPSLKAQLYERIAECFVKIGCILLKNTQLSQNVKDYSAILPPFERGLAIIKGNIKTPQKSLKIAGIIDIIISYSQTSGNLDYVIPLAMYAVEIDNSYERDAMMSRIISSLHEDIVHPNSTDPYETMAFLLRRNEKSLLNDRVIDLIYQIIELITDPYIKLSGLCDLAELLIRQKKTDRTKQILEDVLNKLESLPSGYQKILILTYLATLYNDIDYTIAQHLLQKGIDQLGSVEFDKDAITRRQIVHSIVKINRRHPEKHWYDVALDVVLKITEPVEYINSLIAIWEIAVNDNEHCTELENYMEGAVDKIASPYEKASVLLTIIPLILQNPDNSRCLALLKKADNLTKKINIPSIADTIRNNIVEFYSILYQQSNNDDMLNHAIQITKTLDDDEIRHYRLEQLGYKEIYEITPQFVKIKALSEKIVTDGMHPNHIASLERLVRTVADRGKEAVFFCNLSIFFKSKGNEKLSRKMIQNSIKEARIIRPLSRRAFIMCDISLKTYAAGCENSAQEILDLAIDAATNIRQSSLRDEVFDELGLAIKLMQRM